MLGVQLILDAPHRVQLYRHDKQYQRRSEIRCEARDVAAQCQAHSGGQKQELKYAPGISRSACDARPRDDALREEYQYEKPVGDVIRAPLPEPGAQHSVEQEVRVVERERSIEIADPAYGWESLAQRTA